jgi:quinohemoprotein amine dehydrogenase
MPSGLAFIIFLGACILPASAQEPKKEFSDKHPEAGIPVHDELTVKRCSGCHKADAAGNLTRISFVRTTPEGWQQAIKRMIRLNGLRLTPEEARHIVQYLSLHHGLAPEEAAATNWYWQKRAIDETNIPNDTLRHTCSACHVFAVPNSWRRTAEEWKLLTDMHVGYFPVAEYNAFRRFGAPNPNASPEERKQPVEVAIEYFAKANPLHSVAWSQWQASMRPAHLGGRWLLWANSPGHGRLTGEVTIEPGMAPDEFTTRIAYTEVATGRKFERTGKVNLFTNYAWRGRSTLIGSSTDAFDSPKEMREVMNVSRDQSTIEGRWFWGGYQELEINATLVRAGDSVTVVGADAYSLRTGTSATIKIYGDRFPATLKPTDISLGSGVTVKRIVSASPQLVTIEVDVAKDAIFGMRDLAVERAVVPNALAIYDKIDYIKVSVDTAVARLGGTAHPKGYQQFEAIGYHRGLDGKNNTADDIALGPVSVKWSVEEFIARYDDDDKDFVGHLSPTGFFTPAGEGPNPKRKFSGNNVGDVWIVATYQQPGEASAKPLVGRCYLIVAVPLYMRWDQPEVAE